VKKTKGVHIARFVFSYFTQVVPNIRCVLLPMLGTSCARFDNCAC